jgi:trans-aconitate 2-methyltransferase
MDLSDLAVCERHGSCGLFIAVSGEAETLGEAAGMADRQAWDTELYEARHAFVWEFGAELVEMLDPRPGEQILDLGCGSGQLTQRISERGAQVMGLDASPAMIGQARQNFPHLPFVLKDAAAMDYEDEFDAVFSNAALHWMLDREAVVRTIARSLRKNGRLVAEFGGKGNIRQIELAAHAVLVRYLGSAMPESKTYFPSLAEYATLLEAHGMEVRLAQLFDRPTKLEGEQGMAAWLQQFMAYYLEELPTDKRKQAVGEIVEEVRPLLYREGRWFADYRRLRLSAVKLN